MFIDQDLDISLRGTCFFKHLLYIFIIYMYWKSNFFIRGQLHKRRLKLLKFNFKKEGFCTQKEVSQRQVAYIYQKVLSKSDPNYRCYPQKKNNRSLKLQHVQILSHWKTYQKYFHNKHTDQVSSKTYQYYRGYHIQITLTPNSPEQLAM